MTYAYGSTAGAYVVALEGHFVCKPPGCATSEMAGPLTHTSTTTTVAPPVPISTMVLTFDPATLQMTGLQVIVHKVDLNTLGKVYSLGA